MLKKKEKSNKEKVKLIHKYYERTGFYNFLWKNSKKAFFPLVLLFVSVFLFNKYVYDINEGLHLFTETFSRFSILTFFFTSETILGLLPPEIFIAWSKKTSAPFLNLSILAILSYVGGLTSYFIGKMTLKIDFIKSYFETKMKESINNIRKWGGILISVGALFPLPFSIACMASGMINYSFKNVVVFGLFRFLRFAIYAWAIFKIVN